MITAQTIEGDDLIEFRLSTGPFYGTKKKAFWGWMSTSDMLTESQIVVLQGSGEFSPGVTITADFRPGNAAPMFLYMVERDTEPAKTFWFNNDLDSGPIGPGQAFSAIGIVSGWRVYRSQFKTQISNPTEFRIS